MHAYIHEFQCKHVQLYGYDTKTCILNLYANNDDRNQYVHMRGLRENPTTNCNTRTCKTNVHPYIQTDRKTDTQSDRETATQTDGKTHRHTDTKTHGHRDTNTHVDPHKHTHVYTHTYTIK